MNSFVILFCSFYVLSVQCEVTLEADPPSIEVEVSHRAVLKCCCKSGGDEHFFWIKSTQSANKTVQERFVHSNDKESQRSRVKGEPKQCGELILERAKLEDTGFYRCFLNVSRVLTHGTYLQVYVPIAKTINIRESVKNWILTTEGLLLLLCVTLPSASLLFKVKNLDELKKRNAIKEEENIYQGLNLDDCCAGYDEIERLEGRGMYEDVGSQEEDIQLEKPETP